MIPQIIITFSSSGALQAELPGRNGHREIVPLPEPYCHSILLRLLKSSALDAAREATIAHEQARSSIDYDTAIDRLQTRRAAAKLKFLESLTGVLPRLKGGKAAPKVPNPYADPDQIGI